MSFDLNKSRINNYQEAEADEEAIQQLPRSHEEVLVVLAAPQALLMLMVKSCVSSRVS